MSLGSDGEFLLDTSKPYNAERIAPERVYLGQRNLVQWFDNPWGRRSGGIASIRQDIEDERAEQGLE